MVRTRNVGDQHVVGAGVVTEAMARSPWFERQEELDLRGVPAFRRVLRPLLGRARPGGLRRFALAMTRDDAESVRELLEWIRGVSFERLVFDVSRDPCPREPPWWDDWYDGYFGNRWELAQALGELPARIGVCHLVGFQHRDLRIVLEHVAPSKVLEALVLERCTLHEDELELLVRGARMGAMKEVRAFENTMQVTEGVRRDLEDDLLLPGAVREFVSS